MGDDDDWNKLTIEEKVVHKLWKARVAGYEEAAKRFRLISDEKSPEYNNFLGIIKKFVIDTNAVAQEKGLVAVLSFVKNAACASKCCSEIISGIVVKVLSGRTKTKQLGIDICLMYVELEKQDVVVEELINGFSNKQPKIIAACVSIIATALREFGGKVILMKTLVKNIPTLLSHSDKTVREETKQLAIEIYKWIRDAIKPQLQNIKPVQLKELEEEWEKVDAAPPQPTRFTRTEQAKMAAAPPLENSGSDDGADSGGDVAAAAPVVVDAWEMFDPVEILSKLPANFYEQVESKKWQERKESLEALDKLTSNPKLEPGQYGEVCAILKKIITKDSNVMVVALAAKCVTGLAKGLKKKFQTYSGLLISAIFGKFKEKKLNVVLALRDAIDAVFATTNFGNIIEDLLAALDNKNPSIKEETCKFLTRMFSTSTPATLPKGIIKQIIPALVKKLEDTVGPVRDSAAEAIGTAMKVVGERAMVALIEPLDKLKQDKVKECFEKAEVSGASGGASASKPVATSAAAATAPPPKKAEPEKKPQASKPPTKRAATKPKNAGATKKKAPAKSAPKKKKKDNGFAADQVEPTENEMPEGLVDAKAGEIFGEARLKGMSSANWKERLEAVEEMSKVVEGMSGDIPSQVLVRILAKKPGWKDSNFQVLNGKFKMLAIIAAKSDFTRRSACYAIAGLISKIGDIKLKTQVKETLKIFAENISLNYISLKVAKSAEEAKNPKLHTESLVWMTESIKEFGFRIDLKPHIAFIKTSLEHTNPGVRKAAIEFLATLCIFVGANIRVFFDEEKPALLQQIDAEFEKVKDEKPPMPIRKFVDDEEEEADAGGGGNEDDECEDEVDTSGGISMEDMVERVNISDKLTEAVLAKLMDKNWKIRKEGLEEVQGIIAQAKFITPDVNELPASLKARFADNNKVLVTMSINICKQLAETGGSGMSRHKNTILPGIIGTFSDGKPMIRKLGEDALDSWHSKIGFLPFLDNEILSTALQIANPNVRSVLLGWLEKKLPNEKKLPSDLKLSIPPLYSCLEDRNPDVRKAAQAVTPFFMAHLGFDTMSKGTAKLDPSSKTVVLAILEKAREVCVPIEAPEKKSKGSTTKGVGASQAAKSAAVAAATAKSAVDSAKEPVKKSAPKKEEKSEGKKVDSKKSAAPSSARGKKKAQEEDDGPTLIHKVGKADRIKDEKKLKVLKWNFTTPRNEIVEQLKDQIQPCVSPSMFLKLFHKDFKFHLEAVALLSAAVANSKDVVIESLDLILKWVSLRFFDTNTSVLLKVLEFLNVLFNMLDENTYQLTSFEGSTFIPYLVMKIGDPKDNVRKSVKDIFKLITGIYPASKMFTYLMEGLQSKNSKSRMECCEELGLLIAKFGMDVCQPSPKILKDIAVQIGDRDNGVRSAALNCIVAAYNIVGDSVYKLVGKLPEKDQSYLEERIKRTGKQAEAPPKQVAKSRQPAERPKTAKQPEAAAENVPAKNIAAERPMTAPAIKREFELDFKAIEGDDDTLTINLPKLKAVDLDDVLEASNIPEGLLRTYGNVNKSMNQSSSVAFMKDVASLLDLTIAKISSGDMQVAMESLVQMEDVFKKSKTDDEILKRVDQYLVTSLVQLKMLFTHHIENKENSTDDLERLLKLLLSGILALFDAQCYACLVSRNVLKDIILNFVTILNDKMLLKFEEPDLSIQCVNRLLLRAITNSNKTSCLSACIQLLQNLSENENSSTTLVKLIMKCIWKLTHLLPDFINEVKLEQILLDIDNFYKVLPTSFWRTRSDRVPQQTIKALLQTLCKLRPSELMDCLDMVENQNSSEVAHFVTKYCSKGKTTPLEDNKTATTSSKPQPVKVGQPTSETLAEIFKRIGSKENSRAGIIELYHFKQKYPTYNVDPFIESTSPFFQSFIDRSLKTIAAEEKGKTFNDNGNASSQPLTSSSLETNVTSESSMYLDRLKMLKEKYHKTSSSQYAMKTAQEDKPIEPQVSTTPREPEPEEASVPEVKTKSFDLADIKRRLAMVKAGKN